ncbi:metallophosphoesterase [Agromyces humi]|uniref:metallophosphoesterase n=1 Tax=Agromyces humi TaxID=1766800 RepID=UPI00135AE6F2|nr:metallophosphoesterase [Agromyces humi]
MTPHSDDLTLPGETRAAVAGDWHGNHMWIQQKIPALARAHPDVQTILHLGDFGIWPGPTGKKFLTSVDYWVGKAREAGSNLSRILVTVGNHEDHDRLEKRFASRPGEPIQLSETVWALPRPYRFTLNGVRFLSLGGGASVDFPWRAEGRTWWPAERITDEQVDAAIAGGAADIMLTHETVNGGTRAIETILASNPHGFLLHALAYSAESRMQVTRVWNAVRPRVLFHGHMHAKDMITLPDGRSVRSLGCDQQAGNIGVLELDGTDRFTFIPRADRAWWPREARRPDLRPWRPGRRP